MSDESSRADLHPLLTCVYWTAPAVLSLLLYYRGLWCWFHGDDFSLLLLVSLPDHEFWPALWQPRAQGTLRPLSERLFFYYFYHWVGLDAFPYRLLVFATHVVNLMLLAAVTHRLTGRRWAGFAAASLWGLHHGLASSLTWTSAYNQILCAFFFLLSFWLFLRFVTTGRWHYYLVQWVTFILGFGAHEIMVVYPAVLFAYVVLLDRRRWPHVALMFLASASLGWLQWRTVQALASGVYPAPGSDHIRQRPEFKAIETFALSKEDTLRAIQRKNIVVYDASGPRLVDVTPQYSALVKLKLE